jgi:hypothetical protein
MENSAKKYNVAESGKNTQFSSTNQPEKRGLPKGYKNRAALIKKFLDIENMCKDVDGEQSSLSQEEQMTIAAINKAKKGDMRAWKEMMDGRYGKNPDKIEMESPKEEDQYDYSKLTDEELLTVERILNKAKIIADKREY